MLIAGVSRLHLDICLSPCIFVSVIKNERAVTLYVLRNESQFLIETNSAGQPKLEGYFFQLLNCSVAAAGSFEVNNII